MDKQSMTLGMLIGRQIAGLRSARKEPVAYLYNGVRFPVLPEYDAEKYPYIACSLSGYFVAIQNPSRLEHISTTGKICLGAAPGESFLLWSYGSTGEFTSVVETENPHDYYQVLITDPIWSNYDILDADGNLYLAASEPVPVYE